MKVRRSPQRGYVMMVVVVLGVVLGALATMLLNSTARDRSESSQQTSSVQAVYAAEAAVAVGVEQLRAELETNLQPDLAAIETATRAAAILGIPEAKYPFISVKYYSPATNTASYTPMAASALSPIATGPNAGLQAQQTPIQVMVAATVNNATSSVADAIRVDLIPVFQFALFFDGDMETYVPAPMTVSGRVHANGDIWFSNSSTGLVSFTEKVTSAKLLRSRSAHSSSAAVVSNLTKLRNASNAATSLPTDWPKSTDALQKTAIQSTFGAAGKVGDRSTGVLPLSIPLRLSTNPLCENDASCGPDKACTKIRPSDPSGVCMDKIVSRPSTCSDGTTAQFPQSYAVELIKRPRPAYANVGLTAPYNDGVDTDIYTADYGPRPAITNAITGTREYNDIFEVQVARSVPLLPYQESDDDPGAVLDRMYWKADIRIIDGVWYRAGQVNPIFDPETYAAAAGGPNPSDVAHKFARVLRYSWFWDARETRVYCTGSAKNCVSDSNRFQRGQQIRTADFDGAAFMALLEDATARAMLFPSGSVPAEGVILFMSETYDAKYEDTNTKLPRAANVRNFLNVPYLHNHLSLANTQTPASPLPTRVSPARNSTGTGAPPPTPYQLGWYPENIWGRNAPAGFRSLTPAYNSSGTVLTAYGTPAEQTNMIAAYTNPNTGGTASVECQRATALTATRRPASRPASFATPGIIPTCIQAGATPLGPENAVRIVRGQTLPSQGFTFVTDNRLYIHGDVNTRGDSTTTSGGFTTYQDIGGKMAFLADSVTLLSEKFDDRTRQEDRFEGFFRSADDALLRTFTSATTKVEPWVTTQTPGTAPDMCTVGNTVALATYVNASLLMGDVPACIDKGDANGNRSGGVNNFPRFNEAWSGVRSTINGSMVGLFRSEQGNARFLYQSYTSGGMTTSRTSGGYPNAADACMYSAPDRNWTFDNTLLTGISALPPGTPRVVATDRLRWVRR